jgi:hypothetical protein
MLFIGVCFLGFLAHILAEENLHINMDLTSPPHHFGLSNFNDMGLVCRVDHFFMIILLFYGLVLV